MTDFFKSKTIEKPTHTPSSNISSAKADIFFIYLIIKEKIMWALKVLESGFSYKAMFSESEIATKFTCGETKCSYLTVFGISPHFIWFLLLLRYLHVTCQDIEQPESKPPPYLIAWLDEIEKSPESGIKKGLASCAVVVAEPDESRSSSFNGFAPERPPEHRAPSHNPSWQVSAVPRK